MHVHATKIKAAHEIFGEDLAESDDDADFIVESTRAQLQAEGLL